MWGLRSHDLDRRPAAPSLYSVFSVFLLFLLGSNAHIRHACHPIRIQLAEFLETLRPPNLPIVALSIKWSCDLGSCSRHPGIATMLTGSLVGGARTHQSRSHAPLGSQTGSGITSQVVGNRW